VRAGVKAVPAVQIEAGTALGLSPWQLFRFVVWLPALRAVFPALGSHVVTGLYLAMCLGFQAAFAAIHRALFARWGDG
jgi:ABC-type amino acid transport system permease subunit